MRNAVLSSQEKKDSARDNNKQETIIVCRRIKILQKVWRHSHLQICSHLSIIIHMYVYSLQLYGVYKFSTINLCPQPLFEVFFLLNIRLFTVDIYIIFNRTFQRIQHQVFRYSDWRRTQLQVLLNVIMQMNIHLCKYISHTLQFSFQSVCFTLHIIGNYFHYIVSFCRVI